MTMPPPPPLPWWRQHAPRRRPRPEPPAAPPARPLVAVVTDSAAALPPAWVAAATADGGLTVVAMPVILGADVYADDDADLEQHISLALATGTPVSTSRPSPGQFEKAYRAAAAAGYTAIVSIHISRALSGTLDAAALAAERSPLPVTLVDSGSVGMGLGAAVQAAVAAAADGGTPEQVARRADTVAADGTVLFYVPSLEQLRRGGRISSASSWVGTVLDLKPLLGIRDGAIVPLEKVRTAPKALARLAALATQELHSRDAASSSLSVHYFGNEPQALQLRTTLRTHTPAVAPAQLTRLPAVLAAHAGLGVLVVVISGPRTPPQRP